MGKSVKETGLDRSLPHIGVIMEKTDPDVYPRYALPEGFVFSSYQDGFEKQWIQLQYDVGQVDSLEEAKSIFYDEFLSGIRYLDSNALPELPGDTRLTQYPFFREMCRRMVFIIDSRNTVVGSGAVWMGNTFGEQRQRLHWVAVKPQYQGRGIAKALISKLLDRCHELGFQDYIYLTSQTWSYRAIHIYMKFGFQPYMGEQPKNWKASDYRSENKKAWELIYQMLSQKQNTKTE